MPGMEIHPAPVDRGLFFSYNHAQFMGMLPSGKAAVCKIAMSRFDSDHPLYFSNAEMVELVDTRDLKSLEQ